MFTFNKNFNSFWRDKRDASVLFWATIFMDNLFILMYFSGIEMSITCVWCHILAFLSKHDDIMMSERLIGAHRGAALPAAAVR